LFSNTWGNQNTANGFQTLYNTTGFNNTANWYQALFGNTTGIQNTANGFQTLYNNTTGSNNTALGHNTALGITTGNNNTILGANVTGLAAGLSNNIIIADGSGNRRINVDATGNVGIGTINPTAKLDVAGAGTNNLSVRLTPDLSRVRLNGVDLLGYAGGNLWMIWNNPTSTLNIWSAWDWDQQIGIVYTPGTIGAGGGELTIGQTDKNNAQYTHGVTKLFTNGIERLRINNTGNVGIGTINPWSKLDIRGIGTWRGIITDPNDNGYILTSYNASAGNAEQFNIKHNLWAAEIRNERWNINILPFSNVGIGTITPEAKLEVAGQAKINNGINLNRIGSPLTGIKYFSNTFKAWQQYMAPAGAGQWVDGDITAPTWTLVTNWGLRSFIENAWWYGWTWESGAAMSTTPSIVAELSSATGNFRTIGQMTATQFNGSLNGNATSANVSTRITSKDNRTITPAEDPISALTFGFTSFANNDNSPWADYIHLKGYTDASGGNDNLLVFNKASIGSRLYQQAFNSATPYSAYKDFIMTDANSANVTLAGNLTVPGNLIVDKLVNRTVDNISISGSIMPDAAAPLAYRNIGSPGLSWNNMTLAGNATIGGTVTAPTFIGNLSGNAATATSSPLLSALGSYVWSESSLPMAFPQGIQTSFVSAAQWFPNYGSLMNMNTYAWGGGALQLFTPYSPGNGWTGLKVRFGNYEVNSGNSWTPWKTLLASDNFNSFAPTLTGVGASGTWGIGITGNAATASSVAWAGITGKPTTVAGYGITDMSKWYDGWVNSPGYDANTIWASKSGFSYANNAPHAGPLTHFDAGGYGLQFSADYANGSGDWISFRTRNGDTSTWNGWNRFITQDNLVSNINNATITNINNNGWYYSSGNVWWYSQTYGGGIYMTDTAWLRIYGGKGFWWEGGIIGTNGSLSIGYSGTAGPAGGGIFSGNVGIGTNAPTAKLEVAGRAKINNGINLNRSGNPFTGIKYYSDSYNAWQEYMAPAGAGQWVDGNITAPAWTLVTNWGLRSFIENAWWYGWTWESGTSSSTTPSIVAELSSATGNFRTIGQMTATQFNGSLNGNATSASTSTRLTSRDNRTITPAEDPTNSLTFGFTSFTNNDNTPYADYIHLKGYTDASGGNENLLVFNKASIASRLYQQAFNSATPYSTYKDFIMTDANSANVTLAGNLTVSGSIIVDKLVNRTVNNVSISGSIMPDTAAPAVYRDIGSAAQRWNNLYLGWQISITGWSPWLGKVLTSDATGLATWWTAVSGAGCIPGGTWMNNTCNGTGALQTNTTWSQNTANGFRTLFSNTTWQSNTANGTYALQNNTTGNSNTANGVSSLSNNTLGANNTANGFQSLWTNTTGQDNTANGYVSLSNNTTGSYNIANWWQALYNNTIGSWNTANGYQSLLKNITGNSNVANGAFSLYNSTAGELNIANGNYALFGNTTGSNNVANGVNALYNNTTWGNNVAIGLNSLLNNSTGINNTALGYNTALGITTGNNNTILGANVTGLAATLSNNIIIADGQGNRRINIDAAGNVGIGTTNPWSKLDVIGTGAFDNLLTRGSLYYSSDIRLKRDVTTLSDSLENIRAMRWVHFWWRESGRSTIGLIAQEVEKIYPDLVATDNRGYKSVEYANLVGPIIEAIKALADKWDTMSTKFNEQEKTIRSQQEKINSLETRLQRLELLLEKDQNSKSPLHSF
jgi:hypothetical protein